MPPVLSVAANVPVPFVSVEFAGSVADPSLLVKCTVPAYPVAVLVNASWAVTVRLNADPAVATGGAVTTKRVAAAAPTAIVLHVPVIDEAAVSVAVID